MKISSDPATWESATIEGDSLECPLRVLLAEIDVDRFGIAGLDERVQAPTENVFD
jgi:hypothetical protein